MKRIGITTIALLLLICLGLAAGASDISPAIDILRNNATLNKCALNGTDASFSRDDFTTVAGCDFEYITITKIPDSTDGILSVSGVDVIEGQCITAESLDLLKFKPSKETFESSPVFAFTISEKNWKSTEIKCFINYLPTVNYAPIAKSFNIDTVKNISVYSEISIYDPDNDDITVKINSYPSFGTVTVNNTLGRITYTPEKNFTGSDVFTVYGTDIYGNRSNEATIYVNVESDSDKMTFGDMGNSDIHFAALSLSKNNIMTYSQKGGEYYFSPEEAVNRIDFTVMLLCAAELNDGITTAKDTEFVDDRNLSSGRKAYLKRALDVEIIDIGDRFFNPEKTITSAEARVMVSKALGLDKDSETITSIMGKASEKDELTKESCAEILYNICMYLN